MISVLACFVLMAIGLPIAISFAVIGFFGMAWSRGINAALETLGSAPYTWASMESFVCLILFVLMGMFAFLSGISNELFDAARKWFARYQGGLAQATILACAGFAACTGSSIAGAATMATIAYPEMEKSHYSPRLATGAIVSGGTLGILIPPSNALIIYGFLTQTSIADLFLAGILPGILLTAIFIIGIAIMCRRNPQLGPGGKSFPIKEKLLALKGAASMLVLFLFVIGGLYFGIFTPTEAGAIGASGALVIALIRRRMTMAGFISALKDTTRIACFVVTLAIGAMIFNTFISTIGFTTEFSQWMEGIHASRVVIIVIISFVYIILGIIMDELAMIMLTIPIVAPAMAASGIDLIWFGILTTLLSQIATITPPFAMNVYVVQAATKARLIDVYWGILPFFVLMVICLIFLIAFPQISLFLPSMMKQ
ncbi:MAG: TRAP transporter large permease [Deltaproteobacteria bacterium]|nr:TRAP transporter large permease [Deltaproteobacteria bacterium]